jgi:nucleotide-binding universal stress UspA family protein
MDSVLAAIDNSPSAQAVTQTALSIAEWFEATVSALHVREDSSRVPLEVTNAAGIALHETTGSPIDAIVAAADEPDVVAVVLGARGEHGGPQPAGHTALEVITRVNKPVVVVPPDGTRGARITRILIPLEGTDESSEAISDMLAHAARRGVDILVLHVHTPDAVPPFQDQPHHQIEAWQQEFLARFVSAPPARVKIIQHVGAPAERVAAATRDAEVDLLALGWSQNLSPGRAEVVREALAQSAIPVLLVPAREPITETA